MKKEKFTITPEDEKFMASIGKNLHKPVPKLVRSAQAKTRGLSNRIQASHPGGKIKSHYSGKSYNL